MTKLGKTDFINTVNAGYTFNGKSIQIGVGILDKNAVPEAKVNIPLSTMNRHGLIAGATGTGKTKSIQVLCEELSKNGVPVLLMDIKGDASGLSKPGTMNPKIEERNKLMGMNWEHANLPAEFFSLTGNNGLQIRSTVSEFGPVLLSKILELNDTQSSIISLIFKYCDDKKLPLLDLEDLRKVLQYLSNEGKEEIAGEYGTISTSSVSIILRKIIEIEGQDGAKLFGEPSFEVNDLLRMDEKGQGYINILRLNDVQTKPKLFSTFMLSLLAEVYEKFPEEGDMEKPKLVFFIDEAHLVFEEASKALMDQIETIMKLIRSKGVGIFWITQNPVDIPPSILSQLGLKIQHALRAFTANDNKAIKMAADNFPTTEFYDIAKTLTSMGIGEAFVTALNEKGIPTPLVQTMMKAPETRMDTITEGELNEILTASKIYGKYKEGINRESAYEILNQKMERAQNEAVQNQEQMQNQGQNQTDQKEQKPEKQSPSILEQVSKNTMVRQMGRTVMTELARGIFGVLTKRK